MQFFGTRKQQTWLVTVPGRIYCVLDSERTSEADRLIQWSMSLSRGVPVRARQRTDRKHSGLLDVGKRQNWLYSTTLFDPPGDLENAVRQLIDDALT